MKNILSVGNAICDIIFQVEDSVLQKFDLPKGGMVLCDKNKSKDILAYLKEQEITPQLSSGGSAANTSFYLSKYGLDVSFVGNVSNGYYGHKYADELQNAAIKFLNTHAADDIEETGKSIILVTPDGERTMCTYIGCASSILLRNDKIEDVIKADFAYIEGYLWDKKPTINSLEKIMAEVKVNDGKVAFSLSDTFCVQRHFDDFRDIAANRVDVIFGNEAEIMELFSISDLNEVNLCLLQSFIEMNKLSLLVITRNADGCIIVTHDKIIKVPTTALKPLDTTGAGDSFAAGFIYGLSKNFSYEESAKIANYVAGQIVTKIGARADIHLANNISEIKHD